MDTTPTTKLDIRTTRTTEEKRALRWMARQLRWERTLDALRAARRSFPKAA